jgi:hypothetical protein
VIVADGGHTVAGLEEDAPVGRGELGGRFWSRLYWFTQRTFEAVHENWIVSPDSSRSRNPIVPSSGVASSPNCPILM